MTYSTTSFKRRLQSFAGCCTEVVVVLVGWLVLLLHFAARAIQYDQESPESPVAFEAFQRKTMALSIGQLIGRGWGGKASGPDSVLM